MRYLIATLLILLCNAAKAETKTEILQRIQKIEQTKQANSERMHTLLEKQLGQELREAQAEVKHQKEELIPSLQTKIDALSEHDYKVQKQLQAEIVNSAKTEKAYHKLKTVAILAVMLAVFFLCDRFLGIIPPPTKWYIAGGVTAVVGTILLFKI